MIANAIASLEAVASAGNASNALLVIVSLAVLLIGKQLAQGSRSHEATKLSAAINVGLIPMALAFASILVARLLY